MRTQCSEMLAHQLQMPLNHTEESIQHNALMFLGLWTYFNPWRFTVLSTDGVNNFKCVFWSLVLCLWSGQSEFLALFVVFGLWIPRIMKLYSPTGRRNQGRPLKRLLDTWDRNGSTSGPTAWQIYSDDGLWIGRSFIFEFLVNFSLAMFLLLQFD
jgi:hypothetical protein